MYSDETIDAIVDACGDFSSRFSTNDGVVREVLSALEATAEQKALRADAERYRLSMIAHVPPEAQEEFHARMIAARAGK
jgi:hypothetical protein